METYKIYCDGACAGNGTENAIGSWAYVIINEQNQFISDTGREINTTNNCMELSAAVNSLHRFHRLRLKTDEYHLQVCTDSAYVYNCWKQKWYVEWEKKGWRNSQKKKVKNIELWKELLPYFADERIEFVKVKGHSGDYWNEFVDEMATANCQ